LFCSNPHGLSLRVTTRSDILGALNWCFCVLILVGFRPLARKKFYSRLPLFCRDQTLLCLWRFPFFLRARGLFLDLFRYPRSRGLFAFLGHDAPIIFLIFSFWLWFFDLSLLVGEWGLPPPCRYFSIDRRGPYIVSRPSTFPAPAILRIF